jgi:hypothetical protein
MIRLYGLDMHLPDGKLPGFYAQIVKGIAERATLSDRHKELLIFDSRADYPAVLELLRHYKVEAEPCDLLMADGEGIRRGDRFEDFAVESRSGHVYFDLAYTSVFRLTQERPEAEPAPALLQLEEHIMAEIVEADFRWFVIERQLAELADRVAAAYRCGIAWLDPDAL